MTDWPSTALRTVDADTLETYLADFLGTLVDERLDAIPGADGDTSYEFGEYAYGNTILQVIRSASRGDFDSVVPTTYGLRVEKSGFYSVSVRDSDVALAIEQALDFILDEGKQ